jgi:hypothetical protein
MRAFKTELLYFVTFQTLSLIANKRRLVFVLRAKMIKLLAIMPYENASPYDSICEVYDRLECDAVYCVETTDLPQERIGFEI